MQINKKHSKKIFIASSVLFLVLVSVGAIYLLDNSHQDTSSQAAADTNSIDFNPPTDDQINAGNDAKRETIEKDESETDTKEHSDTENTARDTLKISISAASVEGGTLYIRSEISGIYEQGECSLTLTKGSETVRKTAGIQALPKMSTCKGFNIPTSELGSGTWNIQLKVKIGNITATDSVSVEV